MHTMLDFNYYTLIFYFAFYSFSGWCLEVLYYFKNEHRFVNRGFLHGPFCPIYGFTIVSLVIILDSFKNNIFILFLLGFFLTSALEYFTGFVLEKTFKAKWWDYADDPFNIHGRVCLPYSLLWGTCEVGVIRILHPIVNEVVVHIPRMFGNMFVYALVIYFIVDLGFTLSSLAQINRFYPLQFASSNFFFEKPFLVFNSTREKAIDKVKNFETVLDKVRFNFNNKRFHNLRNISSNPFNHIFKTLKNKLKKD